MHPQIVRDRPGNCPICGMALEPVLPGAGSEEDTELRDMTRRFWVSAVLSAVVLLLAMGHMVPGNPLDALVGHRLRPLVELALATPVVLWGGWPFF
ncbi:MAG TPA: heavy metal-binding domain-containing protein, partial [Steroidobacteraceae bacterium]|nr:heavy metal-binding domain-containing protein [Steroidobacteraceae bacterium]